MSTPVEPYVVRTLPVPATSSASHTHPHPDLLQWAEFCCRVFGHDNPQYFLTHWYGDPWKLGGCDIWVAVLAECSSTSDVTVVSSSSSSSSNESSVGEIIGSVRVFWREVYIADAVHDVDEQQQQQQKPHTRCWKVAGIGEVCVSEQHRHRGVASALLSKALERIQQDDTCKCVLLYTGEAAPLYRNFGFEFIPHRLLCIHSASQLLQIQSSPSISSYKLTSTPMQDSDLSGLMFLYEQYASQFVGTISRQLNKHYWHQWVGRHAELWQQTAAALLGDQVCAFLAIRPASIPDELQPILSSTTEAGPEEEQSFCWSVSEFLCRQAQYQKDRGLDILMNLFLFLLQTHQKSLNAALAHPLVLPLPLFPSLPTQLPSGSYTIVERNSSMYKLLPASGLATHRELASRFHLGHVVFQTDKF